MKEVLLISDNSYWSECAGLLISCHTKDLVHVRYKRGSGFPNIIRKWSGDLIISFKSDLILPPDVIKRAKQGAINFHPSLPKYRGIGGYVLALRNKDKYYGVTCHYIDELIDHGTIIKTSMFLIQQYDVLKTLYYKSGFYCLSLLSEIITIVEESKPIPVSNKKWSKNLYLYKDFKDELEMIVD